MIHKDNKINVDDIWSINNIGVKLINDDIFIMSNILIDETNTTVIIICQYFDVIIGIRSRLKTIRQISSIYLMLQIESYLIRMFGI